jgi:glycosyltransferase involved in cell wall biosynthesis
MITVTTPWEGKKFCIDRVLKNMKDLKFPDSSVRWFFLDNSGDKIVNGKLNQFLSDLPSHHDKKITVVPPGTYENAAALYNDIVPEVRGDWLALEDDVIEIPTDVVYRFYREIHKTYDLAIIGANVQARRGIKESLCWKIEYNYEEECYEILPVSPQRSGCVYVDAIHTGCTLIRPSAYLGYKFEHTLQNNRRFIGHDLNLGLAVKRKGLKVGVLWDIRPAHVTPRGSVFSLLTTHNGGVAPHVNVSLPLVSVITPTNDRPRLLQKVIEDLKNQTYTQFECLICSDGQSAVSAQVVEEANDTRFRYFELGFKHGFSGAPQRNAMLQKVGGELIVFVDDDVELDVDYLQTMVALWRTGHLLGFAQIRHANPGEEVKIIPPNKEACLQFGNVDTLCFFVDSSVGKCFFWDLFENGHDHRYVMQVANYLRNDFVFTERVVGASRRSYGRQEVTHLPESAHELVQQLSRVLDKPTSEAEDLIATDATASLTYIINVLKSTPWPKGEPAISQNINASLFYAANVLGGRFERAEILLAEEDWSAEAYAKIVGKTWTEMGRPEVDQRISKVYSAASEVKLHG